MYWGGGEGIGYIYMIRRPYVIVFYFRTISICEEKLWKDLHCKSWYQCIMNLKVSMYRETSWFAWAIPWHNFTHHSNLGSFFFLFHSLIATWSKIYQMMALLINILFAKKIKIIIFHERERERSLLIRDLFQQNLLSIGNYLSRRNLRHLIHDS